MKPFVPAPWPVSATHLGAASRGSSALPRRPLGFIVIELLVAMALIVFIMSILAQAFTEGLETFRHLKGVGDLADQLRAPAMALREDLDTAGARARAIIIVGVRTGTVDAEEVKDLRERYEAICASAQDFESRLREVEDRVTNAGHQRILRRVVEDVARIKEFAVRMVTLLRLMASGPTDG